MLELVATVGEVATAATVGGLPGSVTLRPRNTACGWVLTRAASEAVSGAYGGGSMPYHLIAFNYDRCSPGFSRLDVPLTITIGR